MGRTEQAMRRDWDDRAKKNALYYIEASRTNWDEQAFFESGERDYVAFVDPVLTKLALDPANKSMLELGCGAGRMTRSFANRFAKVRALDISAEMLAQGEHLLKEVRNIEWVKGNGSNLAGVDDESLDFVFSYIVLQHLPNETLTESYVTEMLRVLRRGGIFLFQFNSLPVASMNLRGRIAWGFLDAFWSIGMVSLSRKLASALGFDPLAVGRSWRGAPVRSATMKQFIELAQGQVGSIVGDGTARTWCWGYKV